MIVLISGCLLSLGVLSVLDWSMRSRKIKKGLGRLMGISLVALLALPACFHMWDGRIPFPGLCFFPLSGLLTWKAVTKDFDWEKAYGNSWAWRVAAFLFWLLSGLEGLFLLPWIVIMVFKLDIWTHHAHLSLRLIFVSVAVQLAGLFAVFVPAFGSEIQFQVWVLLSTAVLMMHYWVPGLGKLKLGPRWYSWVRGNTSHCLLPNAYVHGWAGFLQKSTVEKMARRIKPFDQPLQALVLLLEAGCLFFLISPKMFACWLVMMICMHTAIYLMTGLLFWENMAACALAFFFLSPHLKPETTLLVPLLCVIMLKFKVINPSVLAWWDSPLCGKVFWEVLLQDGRRANLPNHLLCPYERKYGQAHGLTFFDEKLAYWHLGEIKVLAAFREVWSAGLDPEKLGRIGTVYGKSHYLENPSGRQALQKIVEEDFFAKKRALPAWLEWIKAPGEHQFYWSALPAVDPARDRIQSLELVFREYVFFEGAIVQVREQHVLTVK